MTNKPVLKYPNNYQASKNNPKEPSKTSVIPILGQNYLIHNPKILLYVTTIETDSNAKVSLKYHFRTSHYQYNTMLYQNTSTDILESSGSKKIVNKLNQYRKLKKTQRPELNKLPTNQAITKSINIVKKIFYLYDILPQKYLPAIDGGINLKYKINNNYIYLEVENTGTVSYMKKKVNTNGKPEIDNTDLNSIHKIFDL